MKVTVEKLEKSMAKLTIEVSAEDFDKAVNKVYLRQRAKISIPGFRKGKAPRKLIEQMYGVGVFLEDAINDTINSTYPEQAQNCEISDEMIRRIGSMKRIKGISLYACGGFTSLTPLAGLQTLENLQLQA